MASRRHSVLLSAQVAMAAALPWLASRLLGPSDRWWALLVLAAVTAFAVLNRRIRLVWLLPLAALTSLGTIAVDAPSWAAAATLLVATAAAVAVVRQVPSTDVSAGTGPRALLGWTMVALGAATALVAMVGTTASDAAFEVGQAEAAEAWDAPLVGAPQSVSGAEDPSDPSASESFAAAADGESGAPVATSALAGEVESGSSLPAPDPVFTPEPLAKLEFQRPGSPAPVTDRTLYVGPDVTAADLSRGPGHYPTTSEPGAQGNFAVAGHRTGWGSPFLKLDELRAGDRVRVTDRTGVRHIYAVDRSELVDPDATWVLGVDPLGTGQPTLTLTTCDPPGINDRRLIVFATLLD